MEGRACHGCAAELKKSAAKYSAGIGQLDPDDFVRLWQEKWGDTGRTLDAGIGDIERLLERYEPRYIRSSVKAVHDFEAIEERCRELAAGRNPRGGLEGERVYGTLRCPECGKVGGCVHRRGGAL